VSELNAHVPPAAPGEFKPLDLIIIIIKDT
jgi:hypothetical protein